MKSAIFADLESPGTKAYTVPDARRLLEAVGFQDIVLRTKLSPGDLLTLQLSNRYRARMIRVFQRLYPRWLVRRLGDRYGLGLLITASKPEGVE